MNSDHVEYNEKKMMQVVDLLETQLLHPRKQKQVEQHAKRNHFHERSKGKWNSKEDC